MKLLHTSDWHLGASLYQCKRYDEHERFLDWLASTIDLEQIDVVVIAGDIFDTSTPSNRALEQYYRFLHRVAATRTRHVIVIAGNHDSPSLLNAPRDLLKVLNVQVVGAAESDLQDEVLLLRDPAGMPQLIVCAVPYLRDRDVRKVDFDESVEEKGRKVVEGVIDHYRQVCAAANQLRSNLNADIPIVATGHLFTVGGITHDGDGVRELYLGTLGHIDADALPPIIDYLALGHLHTPQKIANVDTRRYSGAPLPMSFTEAAQLKQVVIVTFESSQITVQEKPVPCFQRLVTVRGSWDQIAKQLRELTDQGVSIWAEIIYDGAELIGDLRYRVQELIAGSEVKDLRIKNLALVERILKPQESEETLEELKPEEVFQRCLEVNKIPTTQRAELVLAFREALTALQETDLLKE